MSAQPGEAPVFEERLTRAFAPDAVTTAVPTLLLAAAAGAFGYGFAAALLAGIGVFMAAFFRNPSRSIPSEPAWIKRRLRVDDEDFERAAQPVIAEFWTEEGDRIFQKRQRKEWLDAKASANRRGKSARKAAKARWGVDPLKTKDIDDA